MLSAARDLSGAGRWPGSNAKARSELAAAAGSLPALQPLPQQHVDRGMGPGRMVTALQGRHRWQGLLYTRQWLSLLCPFRNLSQLLPGTQLHDLASCAANSCQDRSQARILGQAGVRWEDKNGSHFLLLGVPNSLLHPNKICCGPSHLPTIYQMRLKVMSPT